ncbi:MAG: hypothetical protein DI533_21145 [Cereibacter sphaeroides]|uniref:Uncharacterized protein n=1 Tax=Cereibacter sphaeroides TaxID=1063 RepID=A0A2W5UAC4_CERSP|nr:MAG: hypothetical protein DI533_21145 [Cereibacter sphaeroides]
MNRSTISSPAFAPVRAPRAPLLAGKTAGEMVATAATATAPLLLMLFVFSIPIPAYFFIGGTRLTFTRVLLLLLFIPLMIRLFTGKAGRIRAIDILMFLFSAWMAITLLYHEGMSRIPLAGATVMEILGGYLVGRTLVRNATDYRLLLRCLLIVLLVLLPFAVLEFYTNKNLLRDLMASVFNSYYKSPSQTWREGYARVASGFEHPILFGLFCVITLAPLFYLHRDKLFRAVCLAALVFAMTYMSLSSAPLIAAGLSVALIGWDYVTKGKWKPLIWVISVVFVFLSLASNRGPIRILIDNLTFNAHTAYTRIWTYEYGSAEVMRNPIMGIGLTGDWQRPGWLTGSVDNFWLVIAMRYGLPGIIMLALALGMGIRAVTRAKNLSPTEANWRTGYVISLTGLFFTLATVHIWGDVASFLMCFVGAGMWFANPRLAATAQEPVSAPSGRAARGVTSSSDVEPQEAAPARDTSSRGLPTTRFAQFHERAGIQPQPPSIRTSAPFSRTRHAAEPGPGRKRPGNTNNRSE